MQYAICNTKHVFTIPKGAQGKLLITITCLIYNGIRNLIALVPRVFLFVEKGEHLILALLCKENLECKEVCASDWLKPISTLPISFFLCFTYQIWFCITRSLLIVQASLA